MNRISAILFSVALALGTVGPAPGQEIPADAVLQGFEPVGQWVLEVGGSVDPEAEIFQSQKAGSALLIRSPNLDAPVLLSPRKNGAVEIVPEEKVVEREDGTLDILSDADLASSGSYQMGGGSLSFSASGLELRLKEAPHSLGSHGAEELAEKDRGYAFEARTYDPSDPMLRSLRKVSEPVEVVVFFGSWCPFCRDHVPKAIRLARELEGTPIEFDFYGLPRGFGDEPKAAQHDITGVPTAVVFRNGREIGRIEGYEWKIPELTLKKLLQSS
ncbi:MAG: thioredoxin family protein [Thermoanaerobaculia bacterium]|nr:thioredoxin family protein [Thermoanaerobaculia bacterium]